MVSVPLRAPVAEGVKVKFTVHDALGATVPPFTQEPVPVFAKFVELVPVIVKYGVAITCEVVPLFVTVTVIGELVVPTVWFPNATGLGLNPKITVPEFN